MQANIVAVLILVAGQLLGGCSTSYQDNLASDLQRQGPNPYITEPELKDLETRIRTIAVAERSLDQSYRLTFDPRNQAIVGNFREHFHLPDMMEVMALARQGYDEAAARRYPRVGSDTGCVLSDTSTPIINSAVPPDQFHWRFVRGGCADGLAHGVGKAEDVNQNARFTGLFEKGVMVEGVFSLPLDKGDEVIQIGEAVHSRQTARLLSTEMRSNGFQLHRYGDFNDQGLFDGFGAKIYGYTNTMVVKTIGEFRQGKLHGFAASQALKPWGEGKVWNVWIGNYQDGKLNGAGAWTNGMAHLSVAYWSDGRRHGKAYGEYASADDNNESYAGVYVNGEREGDFTVRRWALMGGRNGEFTERYANGELIDDGIDARSNDGFGKFVALAAGAAVIGGSGISDASKVEIGGAFAADVLAGGEGKNMQAVHQQTPPAGGQLNSQNKGHFELSCYDAGTFLCVDYTLYSRTRYEQFKAQCSQGNNRVVASCDSDTRQGICRHQSAMGKTATHDYLYGSEPEQVKKACLDSGGVFTLVE